MERYDGDYADYAIHNKFRDESDTLIAPIPSDGELSYVLDTADYARFGIWITVSDTDGHVSQYVSRRIPKTTIAPYTHSTRTTLTKNMVCQKSDDIIRRLTTGYRLGKIRFDDSQVKADFGLIIGELLGK